MGLERNLTNPPTTVGGIQGFLCKASICVYLRLGYCLTTRANAVHHLGYEGLGNRLRIVERSAFRDDAQRLACRIVKHLTRVAVSQVSLKLLTNLTRYFLIEKVPQLADKILAANHDLFAPAFEKYGTIDSRSINRPRKIRAFSPGMLRPNAAAACSVESSSKSRSIKATRYFSGSFITSFSTSRLNSSRE